MIPSKDGSQLILRLIIRRIQFQYLFAKAASLGAARQVVGGKLHVDAAQVHVGAGETRIMLDCRREGLTRLVDMTLLSLDDAEQVVETAIGGILPGRSGNHGSRTVEVAGFNLLLNGKYCLAVGLRSEEH